MGYLHCSLVAQVNGNVFSRKWKCASFNAAWKVEEYKNSHALCCAVGKYWEKTYKINFGYVDMKMC